MSDGSFLALLVVFIISAALLIIAANPQMRINSFTRFWIAVCALALAAICTAEIVR